MDQPLRILGFAGSLRQASYNRALLRAAKELTTRKFLQGYLAAFASWVRRFKT